jgi:hypothetical protein
MDQSGTYTGAYFKLGSDIDMGGFATLPMIGQIINGDGYRLFNWSSGGSFINKLDAGSQLYNIALYLNATSAVTYLLPSTTGENCLFTDIRIVSVGVSLSGVLRGVRSSWTVQRFVLEGPILGFIPQFSSSVLTISDIKAFIYSPNGSPVNFKFNGTSNLSCTWLRCEAYISKFNASTISFTHFLFGSRSTVQSCYIYIHELIGDASVAFCDRLSTGQTIQDSRIDVNRSSSTLIPIMPAHGAFNNRHIVTDYVQNGNCSRNLVVYNGYDLTSYGIQIDPYFEGKEWFIPSSGELQLVASIRTNLLFDEIIRTRWASVSPLNSNTSWFLPLASNEFSSTLFRVVTSGGSLSSLSKSPTPTTLASLLLCTNLSDIPPEIQVGDEYEDVVVVYKDGTSGIGAAKKPVFNGYPIFKHSPSGVSVSSDGAVGAGYANTQAMLGVCAPGDAAYWENYVQPFDFQWDAVGSPITSSARFQNNYFTAVNSVESDLNSVYPTLELGSVGRAGNQYVTSSLADQESSYQNFDFVNDWQMVEGIPKPRLTYSENFDASLIVVDSALRVNSTQSSIEIRRIVGSGSVGLRIIRKDTQAEVYNSLGLSHTLTLAVPETVELQLQPYSDLNGDISYAPFVDYTHYEVSQVQVQDVIALDLVSSLQVNENRAIAVHGDVIANGKYFGSPRNSFVSGGADRASFVSVPINDYPNFSLITIDIPGYTLPKLRDFEAIVKVGDYLFSTGQPYPNSDLPQSAYLVVINSIDNSYKVFRMPFSITSDPIGTDGVYLYQPANNVIHKLDPSEFINAPNQFYVSEAFTPQNYNQSGFVYNAELQGPHVDISGVQQINPYPCHSIVIDSQYIFSAYTTGAKYYDLPQGYEQFNGASVLHVIDKVTMLPVSWCFIPQATDDMTQDESWLFFGIEVRESNVADYGGMWGTYAVNKNDVIQNSFNCTIRGLPILHSSDSRPEFSSYASLIFGNYLLDYKTNKHLYVIDKSDPSQWSLNSPIGQFTTGVFRLKSADGAYTSGVPNEAKVDENDVFHSFIWGSPSGVIKYQLPGISAFAPPTMQVSVQTEPLQFSGFVLNENGKTVTEVGFQWGDNPNPATWSDSATATLSGANFSHSPALAPGTWYVRSYGVNTEGTGYSSVISVVVSSSVSTPTVSTTSSSVTGTSVTLSGSVSNDGGETSISSGFYYGTDSENLNLSTSNDGTLPAITKVLNSLSPGTYYYRAFAQNSAGTGLGSVLSFEIASDPDPDPDPSLPEGNVSYNGDVVQGATVIAIDRANLSTNYTTVTDVNGDYSFVGTLPAGEYYVFVVFEDLNETRRSTVKIITVN